METGTLPIETLPMIVCKRCGYKWVKRVINPAKCPRCTTHLWNEEYKREIKPENRARKQGNLVR